MTEPSEGRIDLLQLLRELGAENFIDDARELAVTSELSGDLDEVGRQPQPEKLPRYAYIYELEALKAHEGGASASGASDARKMFALAFECWHAFASLHESGKVPSTFEGAAGFVGIADTELQHESLPGTYALALHLATTGLGADMGAETRLALNRFKLPDVTGELPWRDQVTRHLANALVRLTRKANGWQDVYAAIDSVAQLRRLQGQYENQYLESFESAEGQTHAALELVGLYHLAQVVTLVGEYLRTGQDTIGQVTTRIDKHKDRARTAFLNAHRVTMAHLADLVWMGSRKLVQNAIWTHMSGLGDRVREFGRTLAAEGRLHPVLELWPSQQEALQRSLLDPYKRAILVEMPTSAGKTLLAEFAIVQSKVLYATGTVAYIVPTRALVNQVTAHLRADFRPIGLRVEQAVPAVELDPTEERLLGEASDVLVTTPEKLDLLLRRNHPVTRNISLVVADEAHNLADGERGARLELLLGMLKRDRADARFLLLSPFLPNSEELVAWLGDERALEPILVDWRPCKRVVGAICATGTRREGHLEFETLAAAASVDVRPGRRVRLGPRPPTVSIRALTRATVKVWHGRGVVLVLCRGGGTAATRAKELAEDAPIRPASAEREAVCHYLEAEAGRPLPLTDLIRRGVAYHHAGLSQEARWLIEGLIRRDEIGVVCGTTTLAQGVNFPISSVIVETLQKGDTPLSYNDFWNVAGRAGRALVDPLGVIAFPATDDAHKESFIEFLHGEAVAVSSQLAELVNRADEIVAQKFGATALYRWPELASFMQFLAHAMHVAGGTDIAQDVEDLLRASLIYRQAEKQGARAAETLVRLCRAYLERVSGQRDIVALADETGFTTPSVLLLRQMTRGNNELEAAQNWAPDRLFGVNTEPLTARISAIAQLPEIHLSTGTRPPFNAERVASILRDWVTGHTLADLCEHYALPSQASPDRRLADFSKYLFTELLTRASWGLGALETVTLAGTTGAEREEAAYIPSMVYFGVRRKEAVWLRMVGVPRVAADGLGELWGTQNKSAPGSYDEIRGWVGSLSDSDWKGAVPANSPLESRDLRLIWSQFAA